MDYKKEEKEFEKKFGTFFEAIEAVKPFIFKDRKKDFWNWITQVFAPSVERKLIKKIVEKVWIPCCHVSGIHDPVHFEEREYICNRQKAEAFERLCKELEINPKTKSDPECSWCRDYPKKKRGENQPLFSKLKKDT